MAFREEAPTLATSKQFYSQLRSTFAAVAPLVRFLNEPLVASLQTTRKAHIFDELAESCR
jgi:hypothetical protein